MNADAIIVGAGIVGAAVADALTRAGMSVVVLEAEIPGGGTTASGMGHVVVMDDSPAQLALTTYSRALFNKMVPGLPPTCEVDRCGTLWVAEDAEQFDVVRQKHELCAAHGIASEILDAHALAQAEPFLRSGLAGALRVPDDSVVYPPALCRELLRRAEANGARIVRERAITMDAASVMTERSRWQGGFVVNAAGAAAPQLTVGLPVVPRKGHLVITDRSADFCRHQLVELGYLLSAHTMTADSVAFNVQPRRTGQLLIGSSRELAGWDRSINRDIVGRMLRRAISFMPGIAGLSAIRTWTGFRPATEDKLPLIGQWHDGTWVAAGHEGLGITTALGTAALLADLMLARRTALDAAPFAPARLMTHA